MFSFTDVLVLRTGVKEDGENGMQSKSFAGCCGGKVVVIANEVAFQFITFLSTMLATRLSGNSTVIRWVHYLLLSL